MTPAEWNAQMHPDIPWKEAYPAVEREARTVLSRAKKQLSTTDLMAVLYPPKSAKTDEATAARKRMFKALLVMADYNMSDCATRVTSHKKIMGRAVRPVMWHRSDGSAPVERKPNLARALLHAVEPILFGDPSAEDWKAADAAYYALKENLDGAGID